MTLRPYVVSVAVLLVVVAGAVALLPFQAAEHQATVEGATGRAVVGNATAELEQPIQVYVEGGGWAAGAVGHHLVGDLRAADIEATRVEQLQQADGPILAVRILELDASYRPLSPTASARWRFVYATSGNASFVRTQLSTEDGPVVVSNRERFVVEGQYTLHDDVRGVISVPQYRAGIADRIASTTAEKLQSAA